MKGKNNLYKRICIHLTIIVALITIVELFVCNYKHFLIMPKETFTYNLESENVYVNGIKYDEETNCYFATTNNPTITIKNIDNKVTTIFFDANPIDEQKYQMNVKVEYKDETRLTFVSYSRDIEIINSYKQSRYIQEDFNGKTSDLRFTLKLNRLEQFSFDSIVINQRIPMHISLARILAMLIISFSVYAFIMLFHYRKEVANRLRFIKISKIATSVALGALTLIIFGAMFNGFANSAFQDSGTQISQELVDSFLHGQLSMLEKPTDDFLAIADPYVPANRSGHYYLWDHVYYNGNFYSYYGVTPVFLLFLPFKVITSYYLYDGYAVLLFSLISLVFLSLAYYKLIKIYCPNLPLFLQLFGFVILFMSCGILTNIVRPAFYEVATSCAFMCMCISLFHFAKSNLLTNEKINNYHLTFMSFWLALAVLSRATYALYAICAVIFVGIIFYQRRKSFNKKESVSLFSFALAPLIVFGLIQCTYNYLRFGSILEFGIKYSLTINDFTKTEFHFSFAFTSLYNFLFAMPKISDNLYFIKPNALTFGASGYYFFETRTAIGLFNRVPILYMIFALPFLKVNLSLKEKLIFTLKYILPCVIIPVILYMVTWESGFAIRYYSDCAPLMLLFILFVFFNFYSKKEQENDLTAIKHYAIIFGVTALFAFVGSMAIIYDFVPNFGRHIGVEDYRFTYKYYKIARELAFWY